MAFPYVEAILGFMISIFIFESYLHFRQHASLKLSTRPQNLKGIVGRKIFKKSQAYALDLSYLHFVHQVVNKAMYIVILYVLPWLWQMSGEFLVYISLSPENEILRSLAFLAGVVIMFKVTDLPLSLYSTFVVEARYGFNKQTIWLFFSHVFKEICLVFILGSLIVATIIVMVQKGGPCITYVLYTVMTIYPILIDPLFNKCNPAYMYGFFKNNGIVLFDMLIQQCQMDEEIVAIIANQMGHWKRNHRLYTNIIMQVFMVWLIKGYTLVRNSKDLFQSFGFDTLPFVIELIIFYFVVIPLQRLVSFGFNLVNRSFEFQADAFAKKLGYLKELRPDLIFVQKVNLFALNTDPWYSAYHNSRPPLVERLAKLDEIGKKED